MILIILICLFSVAGSQTLPEILDAYICGEGQGFCKDEIQLIDYQLEGTKYDTLYDTTFTDSVFNCAGNECIWEFTTNTSTHVDTSSIGEKWTWQTFIKFDLFDAENDSVNIFPIVRWAYACRGQVPLPTYSIDSVWGDNFTRPGYDKTLHFTFSNLEGDCISAEVYLEGHEIGNPKDTIGYGSMVNPIILPKTITSIPSTSQMNDPFLIKKFDGKLIIKFKNTGYMKDVLFFDLRGNLLKKNTNIIEDTHIINLEEIENNILIVRVIIGENTYVKKLFQLK